MYNQQVEIYNRGFIKKVVVDIASLTGRRFDLMQKPLILKVHLWALGKTKCLLIKWCCSSVPLWLCKRGTALYDASKICCVCLSGLEDKAE